MKIGFALITTSPYFDKIVALENRLHSKTNFHNKLELKNNIPHTTLFQGNFKNDTDYIEISTILATFIKRQMIDRTLHFTKVVYVPNGWYFYICNITDELKALHYITLKVCKNKIILDPSRLEGTLSHLTPDQINGIKNYGYRYSAKAFFPHITLGRTSFDMQPEIIDSFSDGLSNIPSDIPFNRLTVYRMGSDGMHSETLYEIFL